MRYIVDFKEERTMVGRKHLFSEKTLNVVKVLYALFGFIVVIGFFDGGLAYVIDQYLLIFGLVMLSLFSLNFEKCKIATINRLYAENGSLVYEQTSNVERIVSRFDLYSVRNVQFRERDNVLIFEGVADVDIISIKKGTGRRGPNSGNQQTVGINVGNVDTYRLVNELEQILGFNIYVC